jgi:hypothetical protein
MYHTKTMKKITGMKYPACFLFGFLFLMTNGDLSAEDSLKQRVTFPDGVSLECGIGSYAHTDEYISKEKYSGNLPYFKAGLTNRHESYAYQIGIEFRYSADIRNYNVSAKVYQFSLNQGFLYPLPEFSLFSRKAFAYIGPSTELFVYANKQNIAVSGFDYAQSFAALFSLGLSSELIYPLSGSFNIESSLNFSVLSLGLRMVDMEETDESPGKPLTMFSGVNGAYRLGIRYYLLTNLSVKFSYLLGVTRISPWEPLLAASDNLTVTITYGF